MNSQRKSCLNGKQRPLHRLLCGRAFLCQAFDREFSDREGNPRIVWRPISLPFFRKILRHRRGRVSGNGIPDDSRWRSGKFVGCDLCILNYDGPELDSGTVVEFMVSKFADIPSVIVRTDFRNAGDSAWRPAVEFDEQFFSSNRNLTHSQHGSLPRLF